MKTMVISLGGSLIVPDKIDYKFLEKFKATLQKFYKNYRFIVVCGGGSIARRYIQALEAERKSEKEMARAGIRATRMNALFMMQFLGKSSNQHLPMNMEEVVHQLSKHKVVFCGALRWEAHVTSDDNAAKLAHKLNVPFINLTNVPGLYTADPHTHPKAKFIPQITWKDFEKIAHKIHHKPGQHFVLDQKSSTLIRKYRVPTYILGKDLKQFENLLNTKPFTGTVIFG